MKFTYTWLLGEQMINYNKKIVYRGDRQFYETETEDEVTLTSVEKNKYGITTILTFTKDKEKSDKAIRNFMDILTREII